MLCLRLMRALALGSIRAEPQLSQCHIFISKRTFTSRTLTRPQILPNHTSYKPDHLGLSSSDTPSLSAISPLDIQTKISTHPALAGTQVRSGPRNTFDPSHRVRKRRAGFLARKRTRTGRSLLTRRKTKRRSTLSH
ncbi:hypothetical protein MMC30_002362 [Trapelia coarctata]|nr:hypothetical protein [Trapelia coarctata]